MYADSNQRQRSIDCQADITTTAEGQYATSRELAQPRFETEAMLRRGKAGGPGYVAALRQPGTWVDWTILPLINVVNDARETGDLSFAAGTAGLWEHLRDNHTFLFAIDEHSGLLNDTNLTALIDTSGGTQDGFKPSPVNAVANAWCYYALTSLAQLGRWLHRPAGDVAALDAAAAKLKASFNALLIDSSTGGTGGVCDGVCSDKAIAGHQSVHSSFYALAFGLVADANVPRAWDIVRARGSIAGAYPAQFQLLALYANTADHGAAALARMTTPIAHGWVSMMDTHNATCTMECWSPEELPNLSFAHPWSSSPAFVVPTMLFGLRATAPGWAEFDVKPAPGGLGHGQIAKPTVRGVVEASFKSDRDGTSGVSSVGGSVGGGNGGGDGGSDASGSTIRFELNVTVPGNSWATVYVPVTMPPAGSAETKMVLTVDGGLSRHVASAEIVEGRGYARAGRFGAGAHSIVVMSKVTM